MQDLEFAAFLSSVQSETILTLIKTVLNLNVAAIPSFLVYTLLKAENLNFPQETCMMSFRTTQQRSCTPNISHKSRWAFKKDRDHGHSPSFSGVMKEELQTALSGEQV